MTCHGKGGNMLCKETNRIVMQAASCRPRPFLTSRDGIYQAGVKATLSNRGVSSFFIVSLRQGHRQDARTGAGNRGVSS